MTLISQSIETFLYLVGALILMPWSLLNAATSAGFKYILLGVLSSCLILLGCRLIYTYTGLTNLESIYTLISVSEGHNLVQGIVLGLVLTGVGFLFKVAAAPFHNWF